MSARSLLNGLLTGNPDSGVAAVLVDDRGSTRRDSDGTSSAVLCRYCRADLRYVDRAGRVRMDGRSVPINFAVCYDCYCLSAPVPSNHVARYPAPGTLTLALRILRP